MGMAADMTGPKQPAEAAPKPVTVIEALSNVMAVVQAVKKGERNQQQGFSFRGIDAVVNAVGPALRKHGVVVVPIEVSPQFEQYATNKGTAMRSCVLTITWRFYGPMGDFVTAQSMGEASDAGDKSVSKAHSVAYRTVLLQALCIPTDEAEPDQFAHERGQPAYDEPAPDMRPRADPAPWQAKIAASSTQQQLSGVAREISGLNLDQDARELLRAEYTQRANELTGAST